MSDLTHDDVHKILKILDELGNRDIYLEIGELKLHVTHGSTTAVDLPRVTAAVVTSADTAEAAVESVEKSLHTVVVQPQPQWDVHDGYVAVRAPTIGTFYRSSTPGGKPYIEVGDRVAPNDTVCVFDVMKLFTSLTAGVEGTVTAILVENEALVEQDQPLIVIKPS